MNLRVVATVTRQAYAIGAPDEINLPIESWGAPAAIVSYGWWQPAADELHLESGRRAEDVALSMLIPAKTVCGDRDRWALPGAGVLEQYGRAQDYSHGPFGMKVPLLVHLKRVEG